VALVKVTLHAHSEKKMESFMPLAEVAARALKLELLVSAENRGQEMVYMKLLQPLMYRLLQTQAVEAVVHIKRTVVYPTVAAAS
jgi:hypothetical protein